MKTYNLYYTTSRTNCTLHHGTSDSPCIYYARATWWPIFRHVYLHSGSSKSAPMVAITRLHITSRDLEIGSGDYKDDAVFERMRREKFRLVRSDYEFDTALGSPSSSRRTFGWRREKGNMTSTVYQCVDDKGQTIVNLRSGGFFNWKKGGEIEVVEGLQKELEELLLASALGIFVAEAGWSVFQGYESGKKEADKATENDVSGKKVL